ncbi:MAG TPA: ABC transporter permease [Geminicoccaceae bacterium]|nr:ABC transporter permease [Geminicoccaceae bacterium]
MIAGRFHTQSELIGHYVLWTVTWLVLLFLILPILVIVPLSFSSGTFLTFPLPGVSLRWYEAFWASEPWRNAVRNSFIVAIATTILATTLGTLASLGLVRANFPGKTLLMALLISPMIVPLVIVAAGAYFFYAPLGLTGSLTGLIIAHTTLAAPFVIISVTSTLAGFNPNLSRAGASLGASPTRVFFQIILPLIGPGVVSGALFAFVTSFDEVVVALFMTGPQQRTLPRQMFDGIRENISPLITAVATLLILLSILLMTVMELLRRRSLRLRGVKE